MERYKPGFIWTLKEYDESGVLVGQETVHNLMPIESLDYILEAALKSGTQHPSFYVGLFEGAYTPLPTDTMAMFPAAAVELVAYTSATRPGLVLGSVAGGNVDNFGDITEFTGTTDGKKAAGGFISTSPSKGGTTGPLISAVRFPTARNLNSGGRIEVAIAFQFVSV